MANICTCFIDISGKDTNAIRKLIKEQNKKILEELFGWFLAGDDYGLIDDPIEIPDAGDLFLTITCKWSPPLDSLEKLSMRYPDCVINVRYEEPGNEVYGVITYTGGDCIDDVNYNMDEYLLEFDEYYAERVENIEKSTYEEFLANLMDTMKLLEEDFYNYYLLEGRILNRLKDEDLPLLLNYEWFTHIYEETYRERLKGK